MCVCVCVQGENKEETRLATANNWRMSTWALIILFSLLLHMTFSRDPAEYWCICIPVFIAAHNSQKAETTQVSVNR